MDTPVNTFYNSSTDQMEYITSNQILTAGLSMNLEWIARVSPHFICSGVAIEIYYKKVAVFTIMLQGHWCSNTFLCYIHWQVKEFSQGAIKAMISPDSYVFYTVPDATTEYNNDNSSQVPNNNNSLTSSFHGNLTASVLTHHHTFT